MSILGLVRVLASAGLLAFASVPSATELRTAAAYDGELAAQLGADALGMRRYVLVVLKTGPTPVSDPEARKAMFAGHFANMKKLADEGRLALAGPFMPSDSGWRGLFVFAVEDIEQARALTETDPVMVQGEMVAEYHPWYGSAALMTVNSTHERLQPPTAE